MNGFDFYLGAALGGLVGLLVLKLTMVIHKRVPYFGYIVMITAFLLLFLIFTQQLTF